MKCSLPPAFLGIILVLVTMSPWSSPDAHGQGAVIRKPVQDFVEFIGQRVGRSGNREITQELAQFGGEAAIRRIADRAIMEGGEDALNTLVRSVRTHGADALHAADNAINIPRMLQAVDDLPQEMASQAIRRLGAGAEGRVLAETVERFGSQALRAEVRHPGIGGNLVRYLGGDGAIFASQATRQQAITLSRHAPDIAALPVAQREGLLRIMRNDYERFMSFVGDFVNKNPKASLFTVAATGVFLANSEKLLGDEGDIIIGADGEPQYVAKPGMIERILSDIMQKTLSFFLPLLVFACAIWLAIKLFFHYRTAKIKHQVDAQLHQQSLNPSELESNQEAPGDKNSNQ